MENFLLTAVAVIPARWASTRFPGKPLAPIAGEPMIAHVIRRAGEARTVAEVIVATDDERIAEAARSAGAVSVMTGECASGTDRVAAAILDRPDWRVAVNVQGDEPMLSARNIDTLVEGLALAEDVEMGTLCRPLSLEGQNDPDAVKVVRRLDGRALYFSRAPIPFPRVGEEAAALVRLHLGIYAFTRPGLRRFVALEPSALERAESLEQLRALENGMDILVLDAPDEAVGVDTPEDLCKVEEMMRLRAQRS